MASYNLTFPEFQAVGWTLTGFALVVTAGRYWIRWHYLRRLFYDDAAHAVAAILLLALVGRATVGRTNLEQVLAWRNDPKNVPKPPLTVLSSFQRGSAAAGFELVIALWAVKMSYMLLYHHIFYASKRFRWWWWAAMVYQAATFMTCIIGRTIYCGGQPSQLLNYDVCNDRQYFPIMRSIYIFMYVAIVSSDLVTIVLPLLMIRGLQMRLSHKAGIMGVICLSGFIIGLDTLRLVKAYQTGIGLNALWQEIEVAVAVIISAMPAYSLLINKRREQNSGRALTSTLQSQKHLTESSQGKVDIYRVEECEVKDHIYRVDEFRIEAF